MTEQKQTPNPSAALAAHSVGGHGIAINNIDELMRFAKLIHASRMAPDSLDTVEKIAVALEMGLEIGVQGMQALSGIAVVNGRPTVWGDLGTALVLRSGKLQAKEEHWTVDPELGIVATCKLQRDGIVFVGTFSEAEAKSVKQKTRNGTMSLWEKDTYQSYPKRMLMWRARSLAYRDGFSDVLKGMCFAEEAMDMDEGPREVEAIIDLDELTDAMLLQETPVAEEGDRSAEQELPATEPEAEPEPPAKPEPEPPAKPQGQDWRAFRDDEVGGRSKAFKDRTWLEMSEGPRGGGRHSFLVAVKSKALEKPNEPMHPWQERALITLDRMEAGFDEPQEKTAAPPSSMPDSSGLFA